MDVSAGLGFARAGLGGGLDWRVGGFGRAGCGGSGDLSGFALFGQALLQRLHDVDDRSDVRLGRLDDLLTLDLGVDHLPQVFAVRVVVFLRFELGLQRTNQHFRHLELLILHQAGVGAELIHLADLVLVIHGVG